MATYKVIQDIEAEDKFLGPLTLKQFVFGAAGAFFMYLSFFAVSKNAAILLVFFMPIALLGFFLAIPWSKEQPTEVWVLAKLRFRFKPKVRIWDQAGMEELVTITVPKKEEKRMTNGLDQTEVNSRLKALADTLDTRGWAVKNATMGGSYDPGSQTSDRLIDISNSPQEVPEVDVNPYDDVLDDNTPTSSKFRDMIQESTQTRRQQSLDTMERARHGQPAQQQNNVQFAPPADSYNQYIDTADEQALSQQLRAKHQASDLAYGHLHTVPVYPGAGSMAGKTNQADNSTVQSQAQDDQQQAQQANSEQQKAPAQAAQKTAAKSTDTPDPDILNLAHNNDWNIETIARQANKKDSGENEVVISLR